MNYELNEIELGQLCQTASESFRSADFGLAKFPSLLKKVIANRAWERREWVTPRGEPRGRTIELPSFRELITRKPIEGWGLDPAKVEAVIRDDPEALVMFREAMVDKPGKRAKSDISDNVTNKTSDNRGNNRAYSITRVQKECDPDTVAEVMAGRMSPHKALVKAGVRQNRQVYIPRSPREAVKKLKDQFGDEFVAEMFSSL